MKKSIIRLKVAPFLTIEEIQNIAPNWQSCYEMVKYHISENIPYYNIGNRKCFQELFLTYPELYFLLFDKKILLNHISKNNLIEVDVKAKLFYYVKNIYNSKYRNKFIMYWNMFFYKKNIRIMDIDTECYWKFYDKVCGKKIILKNNAFYASNGIISVSKLMKDKSENVIIRIDMKQRNITYVIEEYCNELHFFLKNPFHLECLCST